MYNFHSWNLSLILWKTSEGIVRKYEIAERKQEKQITLNVKYTIWSESSLHCTEHHREQCESIWWFCSKSMPQNKFDISLLFISKCDMFFSQSLICFCSDFIMSAWISLKCYTVHSWVDKKAPLHSYTALPFYSYTIAPAGPKYLQE